MYEYAYEDDMGPEDNGWIHEDDIPDLDFVKGMLEGVRGAVYETGDIENLEDCLEELLSTFELRVPETEPVLEKKVQELDKNATRRRNHMTKSLTLLEEFKNTEEVCNLLMQTPHYRSLGKEGIFAIVETAKSIGVDPMRALNGGLYFIKGKVEMTSSLMSELIRKAGHSLTKDKKSDDTICILHGRRKDNGDHWEESFSMEDARKAGVAGSAVWQKYPRDMMFARALSRLARQLFPDVIKGCYVEGEIKDAPPLNEPVVLEEAEVSLENVQEETLDRDTISIVEAEELENLIGDDEDYREKLRNLMRIHCNSTDFEDLPRSTYERIYPMVKRKYEEKIRRAEEELNAVEA